MENVRGLCGNWNGATNDDVMARDGIADSTGFADTWKTDSCAAVDPSLASYDPCEAHVRVIPLIAVVM